MPKICYVPKTFFRDTLDIIDKANQIATTYAAQGYELSLRQTFYQFVARGWLANTEQNYKRLGNIINDARLAGLIDWDHLSDRTRWVRENSHWDDPQAMMGSVVASYANEMWSNQPERPIVMIEKDALVGVIATTCDDLDVPYFSCRGYTSQSEMWAMGQRMVEYYNNGQKPVILHLGDHDPSGIDMTRDIRERLQLFVHYHTGWTPSIERLALNMDQVNQYTPPPNPARMTDSRFADYLAVYGNQSWELDALDPPVISALVEDAILRHRDDTLWDEAKDAQEEARAQLKNIQDRWDDVVEFLEEDTA